jgi:hypothetical protein
MQDKLSRRISVGREAVAILVVVFFSMLASGALLTACASEEEGTASSSAPSTPPSQPAQKASEQVVVRVSGTPGTAYSGTYGTYEGMQAVDGTLEAQPTDYAQKIGSGVFGVVSAMFQKTQPGAGTLKVQILENDGTVTVENETSEEFGTVNVTRYP